MIEQLRIRRDAAGALFVLEDGRYAVTGPLDAVGTRTAVSDWARRRMRSASADSWPMMPSALLQPEAIMIKTVRPL